MDERPANRDRSPFVAEIVEPDVSLAAEVRERVLTALDPELSARLLSSLDLMGVSEGPQTVPFSVFGPGAALDGLERSGDRPIVLVCSGPDQPERRLAALDRGADEVLDWPCELTELRLRLAAGIERGLTRRLCRVERDDLVALLDLSDALITTHDVEATLSLIVRRMAELTGSERCSVILLDEGSTFGFVVASSDDASLQGQTIPVATGYPEILEVVRTGEPLVVRDVQQDPLFDGVRDIIRDKPLGHTALFPVRAEGRVLGVIVLRGAEVRPAGLSPRHLRLGTLVANATAISIRNARLYQSIRERAERVLTARVKAERRLRQLEKYQRFFDLSGDGIIIVDGRGRILFANREAQWLVGFDAADMTQVGLLDIVDQKDAPRVQELLDGFQRGEQRRQLDLSVVRASGDVSILSLSTASLEGDGEDTGGEVAVIISLRDVTQTKRMESELRKTKEFLENLIEASGEAIVASDMEGTVLIFNNVAEKLTGYRREDVVGKLKVVDLYDEGVAQRIGRNLRAAPEGEVARYRSSRENLVTCDGTRIPIALNAALLYDKGKEIATVGIFSDLRDRIRMEERLAVAQQKLAMSERQAGAVEVAGAAAHELSQPLTAILGSAELMERRLEPESPARPSLMKIISECERMCEIVKKIGQITQYKTKPYLGGTNIVDLDAASGREDDPP